MTAGVAAGRTAEAVVSLLTIEGRLVRQRDALVTLTSLQTTNCDALPAALATIAEVSAAALLVSRASVWRYNDDRSAIRCIEVYDRGTAQHANGAVLRAEDFPSYFRALRHSDVVAVDDAERDPRTSEFSEPYLRPLNIRSMLDAPLHAEGRVVGVICFEQVGEFRQWTTDEKGFAVAISNVVSLALERCQRSKAETTLALQAAALDASSHPLTILTRENRVVWANPAFCALTGYGIDELSGQDPDVLLRPQDAGDSFQTAAMEQLLGGHTWRGESVTRRKDGTTFVAEHVVTPVRAADGAITHFVSLRIDLTQRRELEAKFLQAQKMEVVGRLAGGIAHDFNNMLTVINGMAELGLSELPPSHPLRADMQRILDCGKRAASLTRQLLTFSRKQIVNRRSLAVGTALLEFRSMLQRLIGEDVRLEVIAAPATGHILADQSQFEQIILNLAVNAKDAMPRGGRLHIEAMPCALDAPPAGAVLPVTPGRFVKLTVADNGTGMAPEVASRVFEPFFTTKEQGKGTGLGLATVYAVVEQSGGTIVVESRMGSGTSFVIYLPQVDESSSAAVEAAQTLPSGVETILLVEDDAAVREFGRRTLERSGYRVISAANAASAADILEDLKQPIALLVTDVVMPGAGGRELAAMAGTLRPQMRVLFTSGYTDDTILAHGVREKTVQFIPKPYSPAALSTKVREVLDSRS